MTLFWWVGQIFSNGGILILLLVLPLLFIEKDRKLAYRTLLALVITLGITHLIKYLFPMPRPFVSSGINVPFSLVSNTDSFPSGHASLAFAIAVSVWLGKHRLGGILLFVASLVAIGRVLMLVHYPIDVIVGAVIGSIIAIFFSLLMNPDCPVKRSLSGLCRKDRS